MASKISRRNFLKLSGGALAGLTLPEAVLAASGPVGYGFTRDQAPARRQPTNAVAPFATYRFPGIFLRYVDLGNGWLQVVNDRSLSRPRRPLANGSIFVPASAVNPYKEQDLAPLPLRPGEERRVEIDLSRQTLSAWSRVNNTDTLYLQTAISSGRQGRRTQPGVYRILRKRWSRYMQGEDEQGPWDLPFIPTVQYFRPNGDALHGAYWHNNFGRPMSHGCINMQEDQAIRLYRWTLPAHTSFQVEEVRGDQRATPVIVKR
jgi:hypothetical protein